MKPQRIILWVKLLCLVAMLPMFSGCVVVFAIYMRNTAASPVNVMVVGKRGEHNFSTRRRGYFNYAARLLPRKWGSIAKLNDSLPVTATDTSFSFYLPAYSTVLIGINHGPPAFRFMYLQRTDSSVQVIDSTQLASIFRSRPLGGSFWYDIPAKF